MTPLQIYEVLTPDFQEAARIRTRFVAAYGEIPCRQRFAVCLHDLRRKGLAEVKNQKHDDTEGVLWRRKERAK